MNEPSNKIQKKIIIFRVTVFLNPTKEANSYKNIHDICTCKCFQNHHKCPFQVLADCKHDGADKIFENIYHAKILQ